MAPKPEKVKEVPAKEAPKAQSLGSYLNGRLGEIDSLLRDSAGKKSPSNILRRLRAFRVDLNKYLDKDGLAG